MRIKMVRRHATLRWLRSDLLEENIVMLQRESDQTLLLLGIRCLVVSVLSRLH